MTYVLIVTVAGTQRVYGQWYVREDAQDYNLGVFGGTGTVTELLAVD